MPYYTPGDREMKSGEDTSALVAEFEAERTALEAAFAAVEAEAGASTVHATSDGSDHSIVVSNETHVTSDSSDHSIVVSNETHATGNGADHADVATNSAHVALITGNPHVVAPGEVAYTPTTSGDWAGDPATVQDAIDRIAAHIAAGGGAAPIA